MRPLAFLVLLLGIPFAVQASETIQYTYDVHGRLVQVNHSGSVNDGLQSAYSYDNADNRTNYTVTGGWACGDAEARRRSAAKSGRSTGKEGAGASVASEMVTTSVETIFVTSGTSWTTPLDWCWPYSITAIGAGASGRAGGAGAGGAGGGGGALARITQDDVGPIAPGQTIYFSIGAGGAAASSGGGAAGGDTWLNFNVNSPPEGPTEGVLAKGGGASADAASGGVGGQESESIGSVRFSGGNGGFPSTIAPADGSGGGGAGGPRGNGGNGGGAGGAGGGSVGSGGGGGLATSTGIGGAGTAGADYVQTSDGAVAGGGGGGGGAAGMTTSGGVSGGSAGLYGGGGGGGGGGTVTGGTSGAGAMGVLILTYTKIGPDYDPDAAAYFAALSEQPSSTRKALINDLVVGLKADSLWAKIDWLLLLASEDYATAKQASRVNLRNPAKVGSVVGTLNFSAVGVAGHTSNANYLTLGEVFNASGNVFSQNSAFLMTYVSVNPGTSNEGDFGTAPSGVINRIPSLSSGSQPMRINMSSNWNISSTGRIGSRILSRRGSTDSEYYFNGTSVATTSQSSVSPDAVNMSVFRTGATQYSDATLAMIASGSGLTDSEAANLHARVRVCTQ